MCEIAALTEPFSADELEWRVQRGGVKNDRPWAIVVPFIQNRAIMQRLDDVASPLNWRNEYKQLTNGIICGISIRIDGEWITKWDGAPETDIESFKGGLSDSMKRAGVQWGIGRYLYGIDAQFAMISESGAYRNKIKGNGKDVWINWDPPEIDGAGVARGNVGDELSRVARDAYVDLLDHLRTEDDLGRFGQIHKANVRKLNSEDQEEIGAAFLARKSDLEATKGAA
jgi:hypothetical protein